MEQVSNHYKGQHFWEYFVCVCGEGRGMELLEGSIFWVVKLSKGLKIYGISFSGFQIFLRVILFEGFLGEGGKRY